jgi:signal transduction histidine kinase
MLTIVDERTMGYSLGASEYMTKPVDRNRLIELLRRFAATTREAVIEVSDRGPGLPSQDAPIFGRFERAASMRNYGGLGLGLYIVQQIAEAHGGSVAACNAPEGGARFLVRLPRKESN